VRRALKKEGTAYPPEKSASKPEKGKRDTYTNKADGMERFSVPLEAGTLIPLGERKKKNGKRK